MLETPEETTGPTGGNDQVPHSPGQLTGLAVYYLGAMVLSWRSRWAGGGALALGVVGFRRLLARLVDRYLVGIWRVLDAEAASLRAAHQGRGGLDARLPLVFATSALVLTAIEYYGGSGVFRSAARTIYPALAHHRYFSLMGLGYWSLFRLTFYVLVPALVVRLSLRHERLADYGLSTEGFARHLKVYGLLYVIVLPPLVVASTTAPFQRIYPFYKLAARSWTDFFAWELLYILQFFSLELFFRGFMLHPLKRALGAYSIFAMALPYCMIHYDKPVAEAAGAFVAGTVLGTLSLRTRSIWAGVLIHASVALTMDALAVMHRAGYPGNPQFVG